MLNAKLVIGLLTVLLLASAVLFREKVTDFLNFGKELEVREEKSAVNPATEMKSEEVKTQEKVFLPKPPPYTGRDPREIRPLEAEVKLFSQEQREKIYAEIDMHGRSVRDNPEFLFGWNEIGLLKKMIGDYEGARDVWEYASLIRPKNFVSFANLGELYWKYLPDYPRAERNFKTAIENKPDDIGIYISLSDMYFYSYTIKKDLADDILLEGLKSNPGEVNLMKALAALYERGNDYAQSLKWWQKVQEVEPENKDVAATIEVLRKK